MRHENFEFVGFEIEVVWSTGLKFLFQNFNTLYRPDLNSFFVVFQSMLFSKRWFLAVGIESDIIAKVNRSPEYLVINNICQSE